MKEKWPKVLRGEKATVSLRSKAHHRQADIQTDKRETNLEFKERFSYFFYSFHYYLSTSMLAEKSSWDLRVEFIFLKCSKLPAHSWIAFLVCTVLTTSTAFVGEGKCHQTCERKMKKCCIQKSSIMNLLARFTQNSKTFEK